MALLLLDVPYPSQLDGTAITHHTLDSTIGALLIGTFIGLILYGSASHQAWRYFISVTGGGKLLQAWVCLIMLLETLHSVLCIHMCYYFLVYNRFNGGTMPTSVWSQNILGIFSGLIILTCQSFISRCIYSLWPKYRWLVIGITVLLSGGQLAVATSATILWNLGPKNGSDTPLISALNCTQSVLVVAANAVLTSALCYRLLTQRTGYPKTSSLIREITRYTSQGGIFLSLLATSSMILGLVFPNSQICSAIDIAATKIYTNVLLAIINSKSSIQNSTVLQINTSMCNARSEVLHLQPRVVPPLPSYHREDLRRNSSPVQVMITVNTEILKQVDEEDKYGSGCSSRAHSMERKK